MPGLLSVWVTRKALAREQRFYALIEKLFWLVSRNSRRYRCGRHVFAFSYPPQKQPDYTDFICN